MLCSDGRDEALLFQKIKVGVSVERSTILVVVHELAVLWDLPFGGPNQVLRHLGAYTHRVDGKEYVAIVSGGNIIAMSSPD